MGPARGRALCGVRAETSAKLASALLSRTLTAIPMQTPGTWRFKKKGYYERQRGPRTVQRYVCRSCRRNFSTQTFATTYWLKHPRLLGPLFHRLVGCSALRQIARELGVTHSTLQRQSERLGRHCLLVLEALAPRGAPSEPLVLDGFRTFEHSQYWPFDLQLLVGTSHYVYGFNDAELRRTGTMRPEPAREARRARGRPRAARPAGDPAARSRSSSAGWSRPALRPIDRVRRAPAYPQAFARLADRRIAHSHDLVEGEPDASQPALPRQPRRPSAAPLEREPQARDDRVLEAAAGRALPGGDLGGVAQLHEVALGEPTRLAAGVGLGVIPAPPAHAGSARATVASRGGTFSAPGSSAATSPASRRGRSRAAAATRSATPI